MLIKVYTTDTGFILEPVNKETTNITSRLIIEWDRRIHEECLEESKENNSDKKQKNKISKPVSYYAVLGVFNHLQQSFLVVVKEASVVETLNNKQIFLIKKIEFIPFKQQKRKNSSNINENDKQAQKQVEKDFKEQMKDLKVIKEHIQEVLEECHYFSYQYSLTVSQQRQHMHEEELRDDEFLWNRNWLLDFQNHKVSPPWMVQMIQGYVGQINTKFHNKVDVKFKFTIITRRSTQRSGTRCNHRGINCDGYCANFVETECIYRYNDILVSHLQIRGSAPVLWEQKGIKQKIRVSGGDAISRESFLKHFQRIYRKYEGTINSITLMSDKKEGELIITNAMKNHYNDLLKSKKLTNQHVKLFEFDMKKHCKGGKTENMNPFFEENMRDLFGSSGYFMIQGGEKLLNMQKGVFRTNCKSSLDRTNLFQIKLGCFVTEVVVEQIMTANNQKNQKTNSENKSQKIISFLDTFKQQAIELVDQNPEAFPFVLEYKRLFMESGNNISQIYANTDSLTAHVITGSNKFFGKIKAGFSSLKRLYSATFTDSDKHTALDVILGQYEDSNNIESGYNHEMQQKLQKLKTDYTKIENLNVLCFTWNVQALNTEDFEKGFQFKGMFDFGESLEEPAIIAIGIQEMIEIKNINKLHDAERRKNWVQLLEDNIKQQLKNEYIMIDCHDLSGMLQIVFAQNFLRERIRNVEHDSVKLHKFANKGAVIIRFTVDNSDLCFVNSHLSSGNYNFQDRYEDIQEIEKIAFQREGMAKFKRKSILENDYILLYGDLNFRIGLTFEESMVKIKKLLDQKCQIFKNQQDPKNIMRHIKNEEDKDDNSEQLQQKIQLEEQSFAYNFQNYILRDEYYLNQNSELLSEYHEGNITFMPTYTYDQATNYEQYDTSKKRPPSWCDRVFIKQKDRKNNKLYKYLLYDRKEFNQSDHQPVFAYLQIGIKREDQDKKLELQDKILKTLIPDNQFSQIRFPNVNSKFKSPKKALSEFREQEEEFEDDSAQKIQLRQTNSSIQERKMSNFILKKSNSDNLSLQVPHHIQEDYDNSNNNNEHNLKKYKSDIHEKNNDDNGQNLNNKEDIKQFDINQFNKQEQQIQQELMDAFTQDDIQLTNEPQLIEKNNNNNQEKLKE